MAYPREEMRLLAGSEGDMVNRLTDLEPSLVGWHDWHEPCLGICVSLRKPVTMRPRHRHRAAGFTLIELMIVVAIIAILAAVAIPQYRDYIIRTQASEGLMTAEGAKAAIWEFRHNSGYFPKSNESAGLPGGSSISGKYVSSVAIQSDGTVQIAFARPAANSILQPKTMTLSPVDNTGSIGWTCSSTLDNRYLPGVCRK